ncbi:MurR/RpiR family transcriptional regulator [Selenomonas sp.]|uniref:MurR/RpiR family transcriptional regulator n=1 Tax=Selenomonas sp. TaxID=2053611 RepID=UPI0025F1D9AC|nr:MurR/RpiR family transcriptional regulator [Selenomonas sp.]MCI6285076.1 MurR/RpiR family transcriptional regulator [Selenomonas sp.]
MQLDEIINKHKASLNATDTVIWKYIVTHRAGVRHISIHELARACAVSSTTVVRFAQKLGLDGFGELKAILKMEEPSGEVYHSDVLKDLGEFYINTGKKLMARNFDNASKLIHEANRVFTYASGYVQSNVVQELKRLFFYDNVLVFEIRGREEFNAVMQNVTKDDLFIFVSFSGESPNVTDFAQQLQLRDVPLISITKLHDNTLASLSTVNLYVSPARFQLYDEDDTRPPFQSMMPYFLLLEIWYVKYRVYLHNKAEAAKKKADASAES